MIIKSSKNQIEKYTTIREGETKLGQVFPYIKSDIEDTKGLKLALSFSESQFVILGIPEDIGVRANYGKPGSRFAYDSFLNYFVNIQDNQVTEEFSGVVLGEVFVQDLLDKSDKTEDIAELRSLTAEVDERVFTIIEQIVLIGKTPIVIGGGHNNSYGIIKGVSRGLKKKLSIINIDPHADLRIEEGRHSGNGFRYAFNQKFIKKYYIYGFQSNYNNRAICQTIIDNKDIDYTNFNEIDLENEFEFIEIIDEMGREIGLEIDLDSIKNMPSSAITPVGFTEEQVLSFIIDSKFNAKVHYYHLAEGSPEEHNRYKVGKFLTTAVTEILS